MNDPTQQPEKPLSPLTLFTVRLMTYPLIWFVSVMAWICDVTKKDDCKLHCWHPRHGGMAYCCGCRTETEPTP